MSDLPPRAIGQIWQLDNNPPKVIIRRRDKDPCGWVFGRENRYDDFDEDGWEREDQFETPLGRNKYKFLGIHNAYKVKCRLELIE